MKSEILYDYQIIHRLALPIKIGGVLFLVMITVKERTDHKATSIEEFAIYDLYSETVKNEKPFDSSSTASARNNLVTTRSHCQMDIISMNDLITFVKTCVKNNYG